MQKSLLITIVLILVVHGQNNQQEFETVNEKLDNVLERLDRIESCQNNVQSVPGMHYTWVFFVEKKIQI
jgi:hypothetical protein